MHTSHPPLRNLTERGGEIVDCASRYGLVTASTLAEAASLKHDAARKVLERLVADGWLVKHPFPGGDAYFVLSTRACNRLGLKRSANALRQRALVRRCLVLFFFSMRPHLRLLTASECRSNLPALYRRGAANYYFIDSASDSLGWLCLDDGKAPARVRTKTTQLAAKRRLIPELNALAKQGRFRFVVLTPTAEKAKTLTDLFAAQPVTSMTVEVAAVPQCAAVCIPK